MTLQQCLSTLPVFHCPQGISKFHSLMLSYHLVFWLRLLLVPFTVPCRIVFAMPEDLEMWPYHLSFRFFTMVRRSSCTPIAFWILLRTASFVTWSLQEISEVSYSISSQELGSFSRFLDLKLRKHIADLDLIHKDRIYK